MNQAITVELQFFLISVLWGSIILFAYDGLRILHRLIKHGAIFLAAEDIIFWAAAGIFIYSMIYRQNSGIIRGFSVAGITIGMVLYHYIFKDILVNFIVKCIRILLRPFVLAMRAVKSFIRHLLLRGKRAVKFLIRQLKKSVKSVKISVRKKNQTLAAKRKLHLQKKASVKKSKKQAAESKRALKAGKPGRTDKSGQKRQQEQAARPEPALKFERVNRNPETRKFESAGGSGSAPVSPRKSAKPDRYAKNR
jgi:spore cortex biosynthesis protein YabQ